MNIDSIIFDLDGTLWNSTEVVVIAWNDVLQEYKEIKNKITKKDLESSDGK
jgi:phosphoglycolate phosphatase